MSRFALPAALALSLLAAPALAQNGGDRTPAGGAFMSSYANPSSASRLPEASSRSPFVSGRGYDGTTGSLPARRSGDRRR